MNNAQKVEFVDEIRGRFNGSPLVILTDFKGSTVSEMDELRRACQPFGVSFRVVKNTLCKRALVGTDLEGLSDHFRGNVGVIFSSDDAIASAKMFQAQIKSNKKLEVKAGYFEGEILDAAGVSAVAELPSREELLGILLRTMQEGPRQVLGVMQAPARDLLYLLKNYETMLEGASAE